MGKKHRGHRGFRVGKWVGLIFRVLGGTVAASPAIEAVKDNIGSPDQIPVNVLYNYTGFSLNSPGSGVNTGKLAGAIAAVVGSVVLFKIGAFLARRM